MSRCLLAIAFLLIASTPKSYAGGMDAGGGDAYAAEFSAVAHQLVQAAQDAVGAGIDATALDEAIAETEVVSKEKVYLNEIEKDAINYPGLKRIELSRQRWDAIRGDVTKRFRLVLHEYLGIMGLDDREYKISSYFLSNLKKPIASLYCNFDQPFTDSPSPARLSMMATQYADHSPSVNLTYQFHGLSLKIPILIDKAFITFEKSTRVIRQVAFAVKGATYVVVDVPGWAEEDKFVAVAESGQVRESKAMCIQSSILMK